MKALIFAVMRDIRGATAIEYGLIAALVVMGAFLGFQNFANTTIKMWNNTSEVVSKS